MKRAIKRIGKCLIIYIVIIMLFLSNVGYCGYTPEEVGDAIAGFAAHVALDYKDNVEYSQPLRASNPIWSSSYTWDSDKYYFDCSSFASGCYHYVAGLFSTPECTGSLKGNYTSGDWESAQVSSKEDLRIGDLVYWHGSGTKGHALIYVGDDIEGAEGKDLCEVGGASSDIGFRSASSYLGQHTFYYIRVSSEGASKIDSLNTEFSLGGVSSLNASSINYSNFYFNGIPDGKYSLSTRKSILDLIIDAISSLLDYFVGLLTYILRGVIISFISVFDRILNNTMDAMNGKERSLKQSGISANDADDPTSINRSVTIEGLVFGDEDMDIFDINIFRVDD